MPFGVQEGQDSISFPLHLELDGGGEGVQGVQEGNSALTWGQIAKISSTYLAHMEGRRDNVGKSSDSKYSM